MTPQLIGDIIISENRQRREFDEGALMDLAQSMRARGLMQAIVVRNGRWLVAGERRLRAAQVIFDLYGEPLRYGGQVLPAGAVPCVDLGELDPLAAEEAELDENTKRKDLTWQELADAQARLHALRLKQTGGEQTYAETALEVYGRANSNDRSLISANVLVARHLSDPDVAKSKTLADAIKVIKRKDEATLNIERAIQVGASYSSASHTLIHGDCISWMNNADPGQFDVILTDPPYGMGADDFGDAAGRLTTITHSYDDSPESFTELIRLAAVGIARVAKPSAHLYLCCDIDQFHYLRALFARQDFGGWRVFRTPLINVKANGGRVPLPEHGPRRCYETILYAFRGDRRTLAILPDVITTAGDENLGHGAQKPVGLYVDLLHRSARPGDRVLDPFAGTGTIFPAAHELKLYATGVEREAEYYGVAAKRLAALDGGSNGETG